MDNNISELLNKTLSNPEMLDKIAAILPAVSTLMGGNNDKKVVETTALPDKTSNPEPQENQQTSPPPQNHRISPEQVIANENVTTAFKNLIIAINAAQNSSEPKTDSTGSTEASNSNNTDKSDTVSASVLGNILGSLLSGSNSNKTQDSSTPAEASNASGETSESTPNSENGIEKKLDSLKKFSNVTGPEKDERVKLLLALKPFLKDERQGKVDTAIKYMSVAKILNLFGKNGFV